MARILQNDAVVRKCNTCKTMTALFGTSRSKVYSTVDADENNKDDVDEYLDEEDREVDSISRHPESLQVRNEKVETV